MRKKNERLCVWLMSDLRNGFTCESIDSSSQFSRGMPSQKLWQACILNVHCQESARLEIVAPIQSQLSYSDGEDHLLASRYAPAEQQITTTRSVEEAMAFAS